jgi:hypothetical protein
LRHLTTLIALVVALAVVLAPRTAAAERRVALVIGNSNYKQVPVLDNPANDATDLAAKLGAIGFDVLRGLDLDYAGMRDIIRRFGEKMTGADVALVFYAGHGLQVAGKNYLVPVDAKISNQSDVDFATIDLDLILRAMEADNRTNIVFLDACRDNPLAQKLAANLGTRSASVGRGLAQAQAGVGTLIAYSTQPGNVALDGQGRNSPFASALLKTIDTPGLSLGDVMIAVRNDVLQATNGQQVPWDHSSLTGQFYFGPPAAGQGGSASDAQAKLEIAFWNSIKDSKNPQLFDAYLKRYPTGTFADIAKINRDQFKVATARPIDEPAQSVPISDASMLGELRDRLYELNFDPDSATDRNALPNAIREFQRQSNLPQTGVATAGLLDRLREIGGLKPWGAIVFSSPAVGSWGMSWGHASRKDAVADARKKCGTAQCGVELSFFGTSCGAFAYSDTKWSIVQRDQLQRAKDAALDDCSRGGKSCRIIGAACADGPEQATARN